MRNQQQIHNQILLKTIKQILGQKRGIKGEHTGSASTLGQGQSKIATLTDLLVSMNNFFDEQKANCELKLNFATPSEDLTPQNSNKAVNLLQNSLDNIIVNKEIEQKQPF